MVVSGDWGGAKLRDTGHKFLYKMSISRGLLYHVVPAVYYPVLLNMC